MKIIHLLIFLSGLILLAAGCWQINRAFGMIVTALELILVGMTGYVAEVKGSKIKSP